MEYFGWATRAACVMAFIAACGGDSAETGDQKDTRVDVRIETAEEVDEDVAPDGESDAVDATDEIDAVDIDEVDVAQAEVDAPDGTDDTSEVEAPDTIEVDGAEDIALETTDDTGDIAPDVSADTTLEVADASDTEDAADLEVAPQCPGGVAPSDERCDGVDNDCDGATDEDFAPGQATALTDALFAADNGKGLGEACGAGTCANGVVVCATTTSLKCSTDPRTAANPSMPTDLCDDVDNDCDGATDEPYVDAGGVTLTSSLLAADIGKHKGEACGAGACAGGIVVCKNNNALICSTDALGRNGASPKPDTCNGVDDNCNGTTDDDFVATTGTPKKPLAGARNAADNGKAKGATCGIGACVSDGVGEVVCSADAAKLVCSSDSRATTELCDDLDNDCNGTDDDPFRSPTGTKLTGAKYSTDNGKSKGASCGTGVCALPTAGKVVCAANKTSLVCDADGRATTETCDTLDNDCDGTRDEGFAYGGRNVGATCDGIGRCGAGVVQCADAATATCSTNPNGTQSGARGETCDREDDDCDGLTDEGFAYQGAAVGAACDGTGECGAGRVQCANGSSATCSTNPDGDASQAATELCDGADNDCDGAVDNACITPCLPEGNAAFCSRLGKNCNATTGRDNCGATRTVDCGDCSGTDVCGSVTANVCGPCQPESDASLCARLGRCDATSATDNCGVSRALDCGACLGAYQSCNTDHVCTTCGNGVLELGEACDDHNVDPSDDCDATCQLNGLCSNDCQYARDGVCDDGGFGAEYAACAYGDDCQDCAPRENDRCLEYPLGGTCTNGVTLVQCERRPGSSWLGLDLETCRDFETCISGDLPGEGACSLPIGFACAPGTSDCSGTTLRQCDPTGEWQETTCAGECVPFVIGSFCRAPVGPDSQVVSGHLAYELRRINDTRDDWGELEEAVLGSALVVSLTWDPNHSVYTVTDFTTSAADGAYSLRVPANPTAEDRVAIFLVGLADDGSIAYQIANPNFTEAGEHTTGSVLTQADLAASWLFAIATPDLVAGPELVILEAGATGTVRVFDLVREIYDLTHAQFGRRGESLVVWMQPDVVWDCGACASAIDTRVGSDRFTSSLWIGYDPNDQAYWSDAVTAHELGHWVMSSFGTSPGEGGTHVVSIPTLPGQGWSEGFATFFSSLARGDEIYYDKQGGGFFWFDLRAMSYDGLGPFVAPTADAQGYPDAADPLLQLIDENYVAAMCYAVAIASADPATPTLAAHGQRFMDALASPRMNLVQRDPEARFPRGYVRHQWSLDDTYALIDLVSIPSDSAPMVADYLDALRCLPAGGFDVDAAIDDAIGTYPYPIGTPPLCPAERPDAPLTLTVSGPDKRVRGEVVVQVAIERARPDAVPLTLRYDLPPGVTLAGKRSERIIDAKNRVIVRELRLDVTRPPKSDLVVTLDAHTPAYGMHATGVYRFGRPAPVAPPVARMAPLYGPGGRLIGQPVQIR